MVIWYAAECFSKKTCLHCQKRHHSSICDPEQTNSGNQMTKVNKPGLLSIDNPNYGQLINEYQHLQGLKITDRDTKQQLLIHVALGSGEYARVKTETKPQI